MAVVILGGLITATLLNLFVVPSLYLRFAKPRAGTVAFRCPLLRCLHKGPRRLHKR